MAQPFSQDLTSSAMGSTALGRSSRGHIAVCRKSGCAEQQADHENERERQCDFFVSFHKDHLSEMKNKAAEFTPCSLVLFLLL